VFLDTVGAFSAQKNTRLSFADSAIAGIARTRAEGKVLTFDSDLRKVKGLVPGTCTTTFQSHQATLIRSISDEYARKRNCQSLLLIPIIISEKSAISARVCTNIE
jgi:hypothetical protein